MFAEAGKARGGTEREKAEVGDINEGDILNEATEVTEEPGS